MIETMKNAFIHPVDEFTPIPFWFWNDELTREQLLRQIHDFYEHEVTGFVIHPRMGLPTSQPYLSEPFMELVEAAVKEAAALGMSVILYDEGMYPSGAANGLVVRQNPDYASRGLKMREHVLNGPAVLSLQLSREERLVSVQAVCKLAENEIDADSIGVLELDGGIVRFIPPDQRQWSLLVFTDTPSLGHIRGIHHGQDDGEADAPRAADLLNPQAMGAFITLTHDRYFARLKHYFSRTIIAMFTDEPDLLGRGHLPGLKPWTTDFLADFLAGGNHEMDLPVLWFEAGDSTGQIRKRYDRSVRDRLMRTYYKPLYDWCEAHGIALTGHPAASDDIGLLEHFHIPGQDVVWRFIAPEKGRSLVGPHSTLGKCASDAARHRGRRRNLNECFGVCGRESGWALRADEMKWYLDWLFVRGANLISPHAFYYSIRGMRRDERPPDVGPHNIWWPEYRFFSRYIKRMSWLMTDSVNKADVAVLARADSLPWQAVKPLFERQIEFNYLEEELLETRCTVENAKLCIAGQRYGVIVVEDGALLDDMTWANMEKLVSAGVTVLEWCERHPARVEIGQQRFYEVQELPAILEGVIEQPPKLSPPCRSLRISCVEKEGISFYLVVNEGEERYEGELQIAGIGKAEIWRPWIGTIEDTVAIEEKEGLQIRFSIERREALILVVDPARERQDVHVPVYEREDAMDLSRDWKLQGEGMLPAKSIENLLSWTEWETMTHFSGTLVYEKSFTISDISKYGKLVLDLGEVHEKAKVSLNGREVGVQLWCPYRFSLHGFVKQGENKLRVEVTNSLANLYDGMSLPSGMLGPVSLIGCR